MIGFRTLAKEQQSLLMKYITARTYFHVAGGTIERTQLEDLVWEDVDKRFAGRIGRELILDVVEWMVPKLTQLMAEHDDG